MHKLVGFLLVPLINVTLKATLVFHRVHEFVGVGVPSSDIDSTPTMVMMVQVMLIYLTRVCRMLYTPYFI